MDNDPVQIEPPLHLVSTRTNCWRCGADMWVLALLAPNVCGTDGEPAILSNITNLPELVLSYIQKRFPTFQLRYSQTLERRYYANSCPKCRVIYGDFYLHDEPGAPFFPTEAEEARFLQMETVPLSRAILVHASCGYGTGELILQNATSRIGTSG
jgi:hypothetical protein